MATPNGTPIFGAHPNQPIYNLDTIFHLSNKTRLVHIIAEDFLWDSFWINLTAVSYELLNGRNFYYG
jgi:hypothetical protein